MRPEIVRRYSHNPILTKAQIPYAVETVHNAAVVKYGDEYLMLFRSRLRTGRSIIGLARSPDGFHFTAHPEPFLTPARDGPFAAYEELGVEEGRTPSTDQTRPLSTPGAVPVGQKGSVTPVSECWQPHKSPGAVTFARKRK